MIKSTHKAGKRKMSAEEYRQMMGSGQKSPQNQLRGLANREAGLDFEAKLRAACEHYAQLGLARVRKAEEPAKPISGMDDKGRFTAVHTGKAEADFKGTLQGGRAVYFEAKSAAGDRIQQSAVNDTQKKELYAHAELGALCFVAVCLQGGKYYTVPWVDWQTMQAKYGRKYMTAAELEPYRVPLRMCRTEDRGMQPGVMFLHGHKAEVSAGPAGSACPASKPLDLDELRGMAGSIVWVADLLIPTCSAWHFVEAVDDAIYLFDKTAIARGIVGYNATTGHNYGKTWLAYAAKPAEEVSK